MREVVLGCLSLVFGMLLFQAEAASALKTKDGKDLSYIIGDGAVCQTREGIDLYIEARTTPPVNARYTALVEKLRTLLAAGQCFIASPHSGMAVLGMRMIITEEVDRKTVGDQSLVILKGELVIIYTKHGPGMVTGDRTGYTYALSYEFDKEVPRRIPL